MNAGATKWNNVKENVAIGIQVKEMSKAMQNVAEQISTQQKGAKPRESQNTARQSKTEQIQ